jgi:glycosyltransferase involved in cell wall biosynthesis
LRIAVNTRLLLKGNMEGIGWYGYETLSRIVKNHPEHEFIFLFDRPFSRDFIFGSNVKGMWMPPPTRHVKLYPLWFQYALPFMIKRSKADLFLSIDGHSTIATEIPTVLVIHDIYFHHHRDLLSSDWNTYLNYWTPRFASHAKRIATVSEYTKGDLIASYGIDAQKIDVTPNGFNSRYTELDDTQKQSVRLQYSKGKPYFLFVGLIIKRKNLHRLLEAYDLFRKKTGMDISLVVVGKRKWWDADHEAAYNRMQFKDDVFFTERLEPEALSRVMAAALALTYVPVFEGFGIPILEGFASGIPVLTSNVTSMPEVGGDAALYANPFQSDDIAQKLEILAKDGNLRSNLIQKGLLRKNHFSWDITATKLWESLEKAYK